MPCSGHSSPLVTPDVRMSRIRRSQILIAKGMHKELTGHLETQKTKAVQLRVPGGSFPGLERPLAPPTQVSG